MRRSQNVRRDGVSELRDADVAFGGYVFWMRSSNLGLPIIQPHLSACRPKTLVRLLALMMLGASVAAGEE